MYAIYKYPPVPPIDPLSLDKKKQKKPPPVLRKVEITDLNGGRSYYEPKQFSKPNQLDVKKISNASKTLKNLLIEYRVIKVQPEASWASGNIDQSSIDPRVYIFNRDNVIFNREVFLYL